MATKGKSVAAKVDWAAPKLKGKTFAFTGRLKHKKEVTQWIANEKGRLLLNLTDKTDFLVVGDKQGPGPTAQEQKAAKLNGQGASIQIIDELDFFKLVAPTREEAIAVLKARRKGQARWDQFCPHGESWETWIRGMVPMPDLTGADLRGAEMCNLSFRDVKLDGADLRAADLRGSMNLKLCGANLDSAKLSDSRIESLVDCSLRQADLRGVHFTDAMGPLGNSGCVDRSDFSGANLENIRFYSSRANGDNAVFRNAIMKGASITCCKFQGADFSGANLTNGSLHSCDLSSAKCVRTILTGAILTGAKLKKADLRDADLRGANLAGADLTGANVAGADFAGANLFGVRLDAVDTSKAKGLQESSKPVISQAGPRLRELAETCKALDWFFMDAMLERPGRPTVHMRIERRYQNNLSGYSEEGEHGKGSLYHPCQSKKFTDLFLELAKQWSAVGELVHGSITVHVMKAPIRRKELLAMVVAAWYEAFGKAPPTEEGRESVREKARQECLELLKRGKKGVEQWNADSGIAAKAGGDFKGVDFSGLDLTGIEAQLMNFDSANFTGAILDKASFWGSSDTKFRQACFRNAQMREANFGACDLIEANFEGAVLTGALLWRCKLAGASLRNADLRGAKLGGADLRGANLTGAKLQDIDWERAKFDERTTFPKGFAIPESMKWAGVGSRPSTRKAPKPKKPTVPIDLATFLKNLEQHTDAAKLSKALSMLKADRFKLYAQVADEFLTGVVKSQTDAGLVYSCRLNADGSYACCTQNLNICGGLRGSLCKHLLVLIVGLSKGNELDPTIINQWVEASQRQKPVLDKDVMSETFIRYKGAEAGEIDWRPTETIPEDYYAL